MYCMYLLVFCLYLMLFIFFIKPLILEGRQARDCQKPVDGPVQPGRPGASTTQ